MSGFYSRQRRGQPRTFVPWSAEEEKAFKYFETPDELARSLSFSDEDKNAKAKTAMTKIQHVRDSYWYWFESEQYFKLRRDDILFVGFQESLPEDFEVLKSKLNLPDNIKLPDTDIQAHKNSEHLDKSLTDGALENLKSWYAQDYRFISLCKRIVRN